MLISILILGVITVIVFKAVGIEIYLMRFRGSKKWAVRFTAIYIVLTLAAFSPALMPGADALSGVLGMYFLLPWVLLVSLIMPAWEHPYWGYAVMIVFMIINAAIIYQYFKYEKWFQRK